MTDCVPGSARPGGAAIDADLCERIVAQSTEAIVYADRDGLIRVWSPGAAALFGFDASEALGRSLDIIIPEHLRAAHWAAFHRAIAAGRTRHGGQIRTTRAVHRNGDKLYVDMSFGIVLGADGRAIGSTAIARDASARRALEQALREARAAHGRGSEAAQR